MHVRPMQTTRTTRKVVEAIGRRELGKRLGVGQATISEAVTRNIFPSSWYLAVKEMAAEKGLDAPDRLFRFKGMRASRNASRRATTVPPP